MLGTHRKTVIVLCCCKYPCSGTNFKNDKNCFSQQHAKHQKLFFTTEICCSIHIYLGKRDAFETFLSKHCQPHYLQEFQYL